VYYWEASFLQLLADIVFSPASNKVTAVFGVMSGGHSVITVKVLIIGFLLSDCQVSHGVTWGNILASWRERKCE
jgi:hypothetical protein